MPNNTADTALDTLIEQLFADSRAANEATLRSMSSNITTAAGMLLSALANGNKILACGNGGSAGDAQHLSSELVNRFERNRRALPAIALTTESSTLTAIANDHSYDYLFARQLEALGQRGDILVAFSTSGNSGNVAAAVDTAHDRGLPVIAVTGKDGGKLARIMGRGDIELRAASDSTARVQEIHLLFIHCLCRLIEDQICGDET